jgi:hypothetical protein
MILVKKYVDPPCVRLALDPTMKNLREDPITIEEDPISLEDILSPTDAISNTIKSDAMNDVQGMHYRKPSTDTTTRFTELAFQGNVFCTQGTTTETSSA